MHENDKLNIPEKYKKMSVSELRREKDKLYSTMSRPTTVVKKETKTSIMFHF